MTEWPVDIEGVVESVVTTRGPDGYYNVAALGLHGDDPVTARTWGKTRTRHNFEAGGTGYVQFTRDPVDFVEAALAIREQETPLLDSADAWVEIRAERLDSDTEDGTEWVEWALSPQEVTVENRVVPVTSRGYYAVVEATVAASRLDVDAYDAEILRERLAYFESVAKRCGGPRVTEAFDRLNELVAWQ